MGISKPISKERIEAKVLRIPEAGCWVWMGTTQVRGYGELLSHGRKHLAHRASYEAFIGPIPKGMYVCHTCDNVYCVNPGHLFLGTQKQNLQDMASKGRSTRGERNARSKLTEKDVAKAKELLGSGSSCTGIAKMLNVSVSCISSIKRNERWSHV
jgi:hypothetical protein